MYFYLSLGSNVDAEFSAVCMIRHLCERFGVIGAYPFQYTEPEGVKSDIPFLNALVILKSGMDASAIKEELNRIEEAMGRDRSDPLRSLKSRCADIDILAESEALDLMTFSRMREAYVNTCFKLQGVMPDLTRYGLASYQGTASIYLDTLTGDILVNEDKLQGLENGLEASFKR